MSTQPDPQVAEQRTVVVTSRSFGRGRDDPAALLSTAGLQVVRADASHDLAELAGSLPSAVAWIAGTAPVGPAHLELAPGLRVVARYGVGVEAVDRRALARHGIVLTNTPGANTESVADHAVGLMLAGLRSTLQGDRAVRAALDVPPPGRELGGCCVGLVGYGAIGRAVHRRLRAFGAEVLAHDPYLEMAPDDGIELVGLDELVARSDVVSLHAPPPARPLLTAAVLAGCRPGAVLVNTARADLVDEGAVAEALADGRLAAVATDVLGTGQDGTRSPLLSAPNVIATPHIAGHTSEAIDRMGMTAAREVLRVLHGEAPHHPVPPYDDEEDAT